MDDKEKAKTLLQYGGKIIDVNDLPPGMITNLSVSQVESIPTFESRYMFNDNKMIEFDISIRIRGSYDDVGYIRDMKKCAIVPYPEQ